MSKKQAQVAYKTYWDACLFLSLIEGDADRTPVLESIIDEALKGHVEIFTSNISIAEVAFAKCEKDQNALDPTIEEKIDKLWLPSSPFKLVDTHKKLMYDAKALIRQVRGHNDWSLKPADAIHLVTAAWLGVTALYTYDAKLLRYDSVLPLSITEPKVESFVWKEPDEDESQQAGA